MLSRKQITIYSLYNKQSNLLSSTARNVLSLHNRSQFRSKVFRTLALCLPVAQKSVFFILNKSNFMHIIPFIPGGIDNLSCDSRSISRDVSVLYIIPQNTCRSLTRSGAFLFRVRVFFVREEPHAPRNSRWQVSAFEFLYKALEKPLSEI